MSAAQCLSASIAGVSTTRKTEEIGKAEAELYDRQIRLWGLEAQNRLRNASVLLAGMSGLGAEVAKNLMLSGLRSLTIMDDRMVTEDDYSSQFLLSPGLVGENRAESSKQKTQVLNPMVDLVVLEESLESQSDEFFKKFDLVILIDQKYRLVGKVDNICRKGGIKFQSGGVFGWIGYAFFDFNNHTFLIPKPKPSSDVATLHDSDEEGDGEEPAVKKKKMDVTFEVDTVTLEDDAEQKIRKNVDFSSFEQAFNVDWSSKRYSRRVRSSVPSTYFQIRALLRLYETSQEFTVQKIKDQWKEELEKANLGESSQNIYLDDLKFFAAPQLSPVCAIVGSIIGQEAIKSISQNDPPLENVFLYSALETTGIVCNLPPKL